MDIHPDLKKKIPIRYQYNFKSAIFALSRLSTLSGVIGNNQPVKNNLSNVKSTIQRVIDSLKEEKKEERTSVFYSWQSDLPSSLNRSFIEHALEKAVKKVKKDFSKLEAVIDRDTKDEAGSPDIVQTIFAKIEKSDIFVCDVSIINKAENYCPRPTPNPNVLVELGYALKTLGSSHIIMVINETHGCTENLPFDLDHRRVLKYSLNENEKNNTEKSRKCKEELVRDLTKAVNVIVSQFLPQSLSEDLRSVDDKVRHSRLRF
ncbi:MAG: hypothetical protein LLF94_10270, partial [Chlamydiales bacterium]|nr:hypothetical protein [Chlamydiales bacterium]